MGRKKIHKKTKAMEATSVKTTEQPGNSTHNISKEQCGKKTNQKNNPTTRDATKRHILEDESERSLRKSKRHEEIQTKSVKETNTEVLRRHTSQNPTRDKNDSKESKTTTISLRSKKSEKLPSKKSLITTQVPRQTKVNDFFQKKTERRDENRQDNESINNDEGESVQQMDVVSEVPVKKRKAGRPPKKNKAKGDLVLPWGDLYGDNVLNVKEECVAKRSTEALEFVENSESASNQPTNPPPSQSEVDVPNVTSFWNNLEKCGRTRGRPRMETIKASIKNNLINSINLVLYEKDITGYAEKCFKCMRCEKFVQITKWANHNIRVHNSLGWREGENAIDLNNYSLVVSILTTLYRKKIPFKCELCMTTKTSVLGFMAHMATCGKSDLEIEELKIACSICSKRVLPWSFQVHLKCHSKKKDENINKQQDSLVLTDQKRKRNAATRAEESFKKFTELEENLESFYTLYETPPLLEKKFVQEQFKREIKAHNEVPCPHFKCSSKLRTLKEAMDHYFSTCGRLKAAIFDCNMCKHFKTDCLQTIKNHLRNSHLNRKTNDNDKNVDVSQGSSDSDESIQNEEGQSLQKKKKNHKKVKAQGDDFFRVLFFNLLNFRHLHDIEDEFRQKHYSCQPLFENVLLSQRVFSLLPIAEHDQYLPLNSKSMFAISSAQSMDLDKIPTYSWKKYNLFESTHSNWESTMFCGGPVTALAWCPTDGFTSEDNEPADQFLAVATKRDDQDFTVSQSYQINGVIQIWRFSGIDNEQKITDPPEIYLGVTYSIGPIWCLDWCPSGCFQPNEPFNTMGLLAIACGDSCIRIQRVPYQLPKLKKSQVKLIELNEDFTLKISEDNECQATKCVWTRTNGHNVIAGGFSNGFIALWDITIDSPTIRSEIHGRVELFPFFIVQAHYTYVTILDFTWLHDTQWLVTGAYNERHAKIWSVEDARLANLVTLQMTPMCGQAVPHWNTFVACIDRGLNSFSSVAMYAVSKTHLSKSTPMLVTNSTPMTCSLNYWLGLFGCGSEAGEFIACPLTGRNFYKNNKDRHTRQSRFIVTYTDCVKIDPSHPHWPRALSKVEVGADQCCMPIKYNDYDTSYGLFFCDLNPVSQKDLPEKCRTKTLHIEKMGYSPFGSYPIRSIISSASNPNKTCGRFMALGYQAGFVRVLLNRYAQLGHHHHESDDCE